jgi:alpha-1,3-glucosyltransferase
MVNTNNQESTSRSSSLLLLFVAISCCKILCMPSYRSTDFDVHRNWLAITRHLPLKEWYYNDVHGTTVHTLDYPPSFAYWEYVLANNPITQYLLDQKWLDPRCLALLPDSDNTPSPACVVFHRSTVVLSDAVLWWGAWTASTGMEQSQPWTSFLLMVFHPGLFWLDHVHFQYNGMLFGIFLASLGYLMKANHPSISEREFHTCHWKAAVLFALLLTMKHLFLTLAPFYFVYLLRRYCLDGPTQSKDSTTSWKLRPLQLATLGVYTVTTLLVPFVPFLKQMPQLLARLFPFGRGLVHDYWAANVWAIYSLAEKVLGMLGKGNLPEVPASVCAISLLLSLLPGLYFGAWKAAEQKDNSLLIVTVVYSALSSFQLGFHVHEKAILNAIIPMILLVCRRTDHPKHASYRILFLQMTAFGLLGIFPLLFRAIELPLKLCSYFAYMTMCYHVLVERDPSTVPQEMSRWRLQIELLPVVAMVMGIIVVLEFVPMKWFGRMEFLPLLLTSIGCAIGLIYSWIRLLVLMVVS